MDRGAWQATIPEVTKSLKQLGTHTLIKTRVLIRWTGGEVIYQLGDWRLERSYIRLGDWS